MPLLNFEPRDVCELLRLGIILSLVNSNCQQFNIATGRTKALQRAYYKVS